MIDASPRRLGRLLVALALLIGVLGLAPTGIRAATLDVCPSGCSYTSIQAAINAAAPGDTISIGAGTYNERVSIGKNLSLQGAGASQTTINSSTSGTSAAVVRITSGPTVIIDGVTITGGSMTNFHSLGGGVVNQGTLTLQNSAVSGNNIVVTIDDSLVAGGIVNLGMLTLQNSVVSDNSIIGDPLNLAANNNKAVGGGISNYGALTIDLIGNNAAMV